MRDDDIQGTGDSGSNQWAATEDGVKKQRQLVMRPTLSMKPAP
jgi:hypothetical protein